MGVLKMEGMTILMAHCSREYPRGFGGFGGWRRFFVSA